MVKTRLNIPATLVHSVKGTQYKINGILLSINESNDTCSMRFDDNYVENNIPLNKILINEGFIDKIKEYGKKVASYITDKVRGFIALVDDATNQIVSWSLNNVANLAIKASKGMLPKGVYFAPSASLKKIAGTGGMTIDQAFAESIAKDREDIVNYWSRVIKRAGTTDETISESIKYVNETYYKPTKLYKALNEKVLYSYEDIKDKNGFGYYGPEVSAKTLIRKLKENIKNQISGPLGGHSSEIPLLIWGAPGIGKSAIISQTIKDMANAKYNPINLNLEIVQLANSTVESWTLPRDATREIDFGNNQKKYKRESFTDTPKAWLPVYLDTPDIEEKKRRDYFCNTCRFLATDNDGEITDSNGRPFEGGIVFMDEFSRIQQGVSNILMPLVNDHKFGDNYVLASKWGFVLAANRAIDEDKTDTDDNNFYPTVAQSNRYIQVTYVPKKEEWVEWARKVDPLTHEANVPPFITDFIEASPESVWYPTIANGGYDDMLENPKADSEAHKDENDPFGAIEQVLQQPTIAGSKRVVTPRTWAQSIGNSYKKILIDLFNDAHDETGMSGEEYYQTLLDKSIREKTDDDGNTYKEYYGGILPTVLEDALNELSDDYWDYWVDEHGGLDELDPTGNDSIGIRGRYNIFMNYFQDDMRLRLQDDTGKNAATATGPIMKAWRSYNEYSKIFTPQVMTTIWETGSMPPEYQDDDDKKPLSVDMYATSEFSRWKCISSIAKELPLQVLAAYPGDLEEDIKNDLETLENAKPLSDSQVSSAAQKLIKEYSFNINGKSHNLLFDDAELQDIDTLRNKVNSLLNSRVAQLYAHFASWIAKISIQTEIGSIAHNMRTSLFEKCNNIDSDLRKEFYNTVAVRKTLTAYETARAKKDPNLQQIAHVHQIEESKVPILPALNILARSEKFDFNQTRNAVKSRAKK